VYYNGDISEELEIQIIGDLTEFPLAIFDLLVIWGHSVPDEAEGHRQLLEHVHLEVLVQLQQLFSSVQTRRTTSDYLILF
jgi:hypothetical protein